MTDEPNKTAIAAAEHGEDPKKRTRLSDAEIAALIAELEASGNYRVLKRLTPLPLHRCGPHDGLRCAIVVDTETTGLVLPGAEPPGTAPSEVISLAMVAVAYDPADGAIKGTVGRFHSYREPSHPIPPAATAIHGITDADVRGCTITERHVADFIALSAASVQHGVVFGSRDESKLPLIIAHNAAFDRGMLEVDYGSIFAHLPWACSQTQIAWADHGYEGVKLVYLGFQAAFFYGNRHSALADADAVVELLRQPLGGRFAFARLLDAARQDTTRVYVTTRYDLAVIATLKARGYRWSPGAGDRPRAWYWEGTDELEVELAFLRDAAYGDTKVVRIDCFDRFSCRV